MVGVNDMLNWITDILLNLIGGRYPQPVPIPIAVGGDDRVSPKHVAPEK
jgi:hypothetical protein